MHPISSVEGRSSRVVHRCGRGERPSPLEATRASQTSQTLACHQRAASLPPAMEGGTAGCVHACGGGEACMLSVYASRGWCVRAQRSTRAWVAEAVHVWAEQGCVGDQAVREGWDRPIGADGASPRRPISDGPPTDLRRTSEDRAIAATSRSVVGGILLCGGVGLAVEVGLGALPTEALE